MAWLLLGVGGVSAAAYVCNVISDVYTDTTKPLYDFIHEYREENRLQEQEVNKLILIDSVKERKTKRQAIADKYNINIPNVIIHNDERVCKIIFISTERTKDKKEAIELAKEDEERWVKKYKSIILQPYTTLELLKMEIESFHIIVKHHTYTVITDFKSHIDLKDI